jgi:hypothetical protein
VATDARGHTIPAGPDFPKRADLLNLSLSVRDVVYVANTTARATAATTLGASATNPVYTYRADAAAGSELEFTTDATNWVSIDRNTTGVPTLNAGWTDLAGIATRRWVKSGNLVRLTGTITYNGGNVGGGSTIMSGLPAPVTQGLFYVFVRQSGTPTVAEVRVSASGTVTNTAAFTAATWFPLSSISYYTAD